MPNHIAGSGPPENESPGYEPGDVEIMGFAKGSLEQDSPQADEKQEFRNALKGDLISVAGFLARLRDEAAAWDSEDEIEFCLKHGYIDADGAAEKRAHYRLEVKRADFDKVIDGLRWWGGVV